MGKDRLKEEAREKLIFALDVPTRKEATRYVELLRDSVGLFKVGLELFIKGGHGLVEKLTREAGRPSVFLDLKFHDIRETVVRAQLSASASQWKPKFLSVHSDIGLDGLRAAAAKQDGTSILVVTVLTNLSSEDLEKLGLAEKYVRDPSELVLLRAALAVEAGCKGVICSGKEVAAVKQRHSGLIVVTPGIRPEWAAITGDDQKRKTTPREAILAGADYVVVGRPIRDHRDPVEAAKLVAEEIRQALFEKETLSCNTPLAETPKAANC